MLRRIRNTRWLIECKRKKRNAGKRNACVLLKVNIALLISLDFSMKQIWVLSQDIFGTAWRAQDGTVMDS